MRHKSAIVGATLFVCIAMSARAAGYDLRAYVAQVESHNRDLELARKDVDSAEQARREALAALLPAVGIQGGYTRNLKDISQPEPIYAVASPMPGVYPLVYQDVVTSYANTYAISGGVTLPLFNLQSVANYRQAQEGRTAAGSGYEYQRRLIVNAARKLYYQTLLLAEVVKVKKAAEDDARANYKVVKIKFEAGAATKLDELMAEVDWKSKIPELSDARRNYQLALMNFKFLAGIGLGEDVELTESLDRFPPLPPDMSLDAALASRPDYKLLLLRKKLSETAVEGAMAAYLPTVGASFNAAYQYMSGNSAGAADYAPLALQLGVTVNLPVYEGGYRAAKLAAEKIGADKVKISIEKKRDEVKNELESARLRLGAARAGIDSASVLVSAAQKAYDQAVVSVKSGMAIQVQLSQASLGLEGARLQYYSAVYGYLAAYFDWELAAGR